jgi:ABC-type dipeptide/oligopeptide/nickel transport system permease component
MTRFLLRRLAFAIPTLLGGLTLIFFAINVIPGDPAALILDDYFSGEAYDAMVVQMGLDQPLHVRYVRYLGDVVRGDLGYSFRSGRSVLGDIMSQFPYTLSLALASLLISIVLGVTIGIISATTRNRWPDQLAMLFVLTSISSPIFFVGVILILIFSVHLGWLPALGGGTLSRPSSMILPLILPALALGIRSAALIARLTRSAVIEVLNQDYVRTARAKGLVERVVLVRHTARNAMLPVITIVGIDLGNLLGGTAIIEIVFNRPGLGKLLVEAVGARDYPMVQGTMLFFMAMVLLANLLADMGYGIADPRIRFE